MSICLICLSDVGQYISCHDPKCKSIVCHDCAKDYVTHSANENRLPQCPGDECKNLFLLSSIRKLGDKKIEKLYEKACYGYFMNKSKEEIDDHVIYQNMIDKIRKERKDFIRGEFSAAISLVIDVALGTKLNKINKNNKSFGVIKESKRTCMVSYCNGKLDENMECIKCENKFCKDCEKSLNRNGDHVCKPEDIEGVKSINAFVRCPTCNIPVQKSQGCNAITCAVCNTNFDYISGEKCSAGNHGASVMFELNDYNILSNIYKDVYTKYCIGILQAIENEKPSDPNEKIVINMLKRIYIRNNDGLDSEIDYHNLAKVFEKYVMCKFKYTEYMKIYNSIEEYHDKGILYSRRLKEILLLVEQIQ